MRASVLRRIRRNNDSVAARLPWQSDSFRRLVMTALDDTQAQTARSQEQGWQNLGQQSQPFGGGGVDVNVGEAERAVSVASGAILALLGLSRRSIPGLLIGGVGAAMLHRGITGHCNMYNSLGINTAQEQDNESIEEDIDQRGIHVEQAFLINRSAEDLYNYWRNFENLPRIMTHLQAVRVSDDRHSHWVAKAPRIAGGSVEWDAE